MTECQGREKMMMGRGADGGCGTEEKVKISPATAKSPAPVTSSPEKFESGFLGVDLYSQALKALSERSPFDTDEVSANNKVATLPTGLTSLLKQNDGKKKHKRGKHLETKKKSSSRKGSSEKKGARFWSKVEEYFRELALQDIERLYRFSSSLGNLFHDSNSFFRIPALGNRNANGNGESIVNANGIGIGKVKGNGNTIGNSSTTTQCNPSEVGTENSNDNDNVKQVENGNGITEDVSADAVKEEEVLDAVVPISDVVALPDREEKAEKGDDTIEDVKVENGSKDGLGVVEEGNLAEYSLQSCSSIEWVLGSRNRALLTTTRPAKKRKLSGDTVGLERLMVSQPCEGSSSLCHVCSMGDTGDQLNQLVVCKICKVVVHQKCYGVQGEADESWLCSWCKRKEGDKAGPSSENDRVCALCPKRGGALKPFQNAGRGNALSVEFAHLFCSLWIPEVYIDDTRLMEPVLCHGMKDIRGKLVCSLCKVKGGSCVRCSDGSCRTSFHPICAREARSKLEIWGKFGCDDIELRVFCAKHSGSSSLTESAAFESNEQNHAVANNSLGTSIGPEVCSGNKVKKLKIGCKKGDELTLQMRSPDENSDNLNERECEEKGIKDAVSYTKPEAFVSFAKNMIETNGFEHTSVEPSHTYGNILQNPDSLCNVECNAADEVTCSGKSSLLDLDQETPSCSSVDVAGNFDGNVESEMASSVHPYIQRKLEEVQGWLVRRTCDYNGCWGRDSLTVERPSDETKLPFCIKEGGGNGVKLEDLHKADEMSGFDLSLDNEVEGEIIFYQQQLLSNAVALKHQSDQLVGKIVKALPHEMDSVRKRRWDSVLVNQYIYELKEARKQGRKERRHKEAQAVLAAATAAAAASSRMSSLRKDLGDESPQQENQLKVDNAKVRGMTSSLLLPRKVSNLSMDVPKVISDGYSDVLPYTSGTPKEHPKICDICNRSESLLNPILVCSSCKVPVHLNCYRSVKESTGPWYCELCEESSLSKVSRASLDNVNEIPRSDEECGLCGASNGAFRKSSNGQWVHAFCAEWVFDLTFRRGQLSAVAGMETVQKGIDMCSVCQRRYGVCIKCNYGNCQSTFHPSCARSDGYYMYTKYMGGGKMQHKAYCSKHSLELRTKTEIQKHGVEDLKLVKQHRVELEKLRLLCERIVKREKLKRELVLCNHDIFNSKRESLTVSMLTHRHFSSHESSDSATTSLKGHVDGSRSYSDAMQRSDDITVDSALSTKRCIRISQSIDNDQKTEDSSTSHHLPTPKSTDRVSFAGKQIPRAALASRKFSHSMENGLKTKKNIETIEKELVMTSDQASLKNRRLPKGYFYVPLDYLSNGKPVGRNSVEREDDLDED